MQKKRTQKRGRRWSKRYKKSINCNNPKGFSQKQYCKYGRKSLRKNSINKFKGRNEYTWDFLGTFLFFL